MNHITQEQAAKLARKVWGETAILPMVDLHRFAQAVIDAIDTSQERVEKSEESVQMAEPDFCDKNCVWSDHHPDCVLFGQAAPTGEGTR
jgi:trans-aconitate methyltransferase